MLAVYYIFHKKGNLHCSFLYSFSIILHYIVNEIGIYKTSFTADNPHQSTLIHVNCSTVTLLRLFHSETVTIVPQWHCYDCSTVTMLNRSTVTLLRLFHGDTVTIVPQWHCCDCSTVTMLRLFHSDTVTIVPQWLCCDCSTVTLLWLFHGKSFEI